MPGLDAYWQTRNPVARVLRPLSRLFCLAARSYRAAYRSGLLKSRTLLVPVIIVGNISVGGTGKTPLVVWLVNYWRSKGLRPGVLTRGYLGKATQWPQLVMPDSDPQQVGDEAVLLARRCKCPVVAGPNRWAGGQLLIRRHECNILLCDDGLQHYALHRDLEIAVIDGQRRLGNGLCLPAGPLREPPSRLRTCDLVVANGQAAAGEYSMSLRGAQAVGVGDSRRTKPLAAFCAQEVVAMAGIGNPGRFFAMLRAQGLTVQERPFPDHHTFTPRDLVKLEGRTVLMTEKDAVKCERLRKAAGFWYVPVEAAPEPSLIARLEQWHKQPKV